MFHLWTRLWINVNSKPAMLILCIIYLANFNQCYTITNNDTRSYIDGVVFLSPDLLLIYHRSFGNIMDRGRHVLTT